MPVPEKPGFNRIVQPLLVFAALLLILNPELRALLLFTNAVGFEVVGILFALQLRALLELAPHGYRPAALACGLASRLGYLALIAYPVAVTFLLLDRLLCPALITISYGLRCQLANNRRRGL
jgi:hypothetical protein